MLLCYYLSLEKADTHLSSISVQGLQVDDEIVEFGSVNINNFQNLQNIATVVQHSEGVSSFLSNCVLLPVS